MSKGRWQSGGSTRQMRDQADMGSPSFNQRPRIRRTPAEVAAAREAAVAARDELIAKYRSGTTMKELASGSGVDRDWLRARFVEWGELIRSGHKS